MSTKDFIKVCLCFFTCTFLLTDVAEVKAVDVRFDAPGAMNPLVPGYFADPTIKKFGDTYYLYSTTDGNGGGRGPSQVWMSKDFVNWTLCPMNWPTTEIYWAPDVTKGNDGRYYMYYCQPVSVYGAVSDTPIGPWKPLVAGDGVVVPNNLVKNVITLDGQTFSDDNGDRYMYWGTWGIYPEHGAGVGKLNPDMKSFSQLSQIPNTQAKDFFEGSFMLKRNGIYYFMYSSGDCGNSTYRVQYAVGKSPMGEFKMGPNNPILSTNSDDTVDGPGHHSVLQEGDNYYIVYHRHDIPYTPNGLQRQVCADRMEFEGDGAIKKVIPTHQGVGLLKPSSETVPNLAFTKKVTADSFYKDTFRHHDNKPEYAVDDNNATLWRPADNKMGHWLTVDLGAVKQVKRVLTQFEYATWYYQYLLQYSTDGKNWKTFADRRQNKRWGSPMVDRSNAKARYLKLTITGVEKPGLFGAVFNLKVYSQDRVDPLETIADQAFAKYVAPHQTPANSASWTPMASSSKPIVDLDAAALETGASVNTWKNQGSAGGEFKCETSSAPVVELAKGLKAVRFHGQDMMTASFMTPRALSGNNSYTVSTWVNNPQIATNECLVSWAGRGGPDATTAQINYGSEPSFGAVGHWGFADMGFHDGVPKAGDWHHIAVVFDGVIERVYVDGVLNNSAAKLLLMKEGTPLYLGASAPDTEFYDGYISSLRIYDHALSTAEVKTLSQDRPAPNALVQLSSAKLNYDSLTQWENQGTENTPFTNGSKSPTVEDVSGRIAVRFQPGQTLNYSLNSRPKLDGFALVTTVKSQSNDLCSPLQIVTDEGAIPLRVQLPDSQWHQVIWVKQGANQKLYVDGTVSSSDQVDANLQVKGLRLGGEDFDGALSGVQWLYQPLTDAAAQRKFGLWKQEWQTPTGSFSLPPKALNPSVIAMSADSNRPGLEYLFTKNSGQEGSRSDGWTSKPYFIDDNLKSGGSYSYSLKVRDSYGNVSQTTVAAPVKTDPVEFKQISGTFADHDYLKAGVGGTIWDGLMGKEGGKLAESVTASDGVLQLRSRNSAWDGSPERGPFLYQNVSGDFIVQVKVADYEGLANKQPVGSTDGGLMVRFPGEKGNENLVQLSFFPPWNQGNMVTNMVDNSRSQKSNMLGFDANRYLQIIRMGDKFYLRVSGDGQNWKEMAASPIERPDMAGKALQVGLFHATYGDVSSYISFSDYSLTSSK